MTFVSDKWRTWLITFIKTSVLELGVLYHVCSPSYPQRPSKELPPPNSSFSISIFAEPHAPLELVNRVSHASAPPVALTIVRFLLSASRLFWRWWAEPLGLTCNVSKLKIVLGNLEYYFHSFLVIYSTKYSLPVQEIMSLICIP